MTDVDVVNDVKVVIMRAVLVLIVMMAVFDFSDKDLKDPISSVMLLWGIHL